MYGVGLVRVGLDGGGGGQPNLVEILFLRQAFYQPLADVAAKTTALYLLLQYYPFLYFFKKDKIKLQMKPLASKRTLHVTKRVRIKAI